MDRVAHARDQYLGGEIVIVVDQPDVGNKLHALGADIVEPADEGRDEAGTRLGREQRLIGREAERHIDHCPLAPQRLAGLEPIDGERHLDGDIGRDLPQDLGLAHHLGMFGRHHLGRYRTRHHRADLPRYLHEVPPRLVDQRGIGGDAVEQPRLRQLADVVDVGGVDEEFHGHSPESAK